MARLTGFAAVLLFVALTVATYGLRLTAKPLPTPVIIVLTILFITSGSLVVSYIAIRAYAKSHLPSMLFLATGSLVFGLTSLVAAIFALAAGLSGSNLAVTIFIVGALLSSASHLMCAASRACTHPNRRGVRLAALLVSSSVAVLCGGLSVAAYAGLLPTFLVSGEGITTLAKSLLLIAIGATGLASLSIAISSSGSEVLYRYSSALAVTAVGFAGLFLSNWNFVSLVFLTGRLALCMGGAWLVLSVLAAERQSEENRSDDAVKRFFGQPESL